jgi:acyl-CoA synthetase (NDP forming)
MSENIKDDQMDIFFNPKTIAIIGASESFRFGYSMTKYLLNSEFITYPVNISKEQIFGCKVYKNINDIPDDIDLAILIVPNDNVLQAVQDCIKKNVKGIIIETAGFAETGIEKYVEIQKSIANLSRKSNTRIIGPNCVGVTNFKNKFTTSEIDFDDTLENGVISVIAQSGVLGNIFIDWATSQKIAFSKAITLGNKVDVDEIDMLNYLEKDPYTKVITLYLEGTKRGSELIKTLKNLTKPLIILKNGRSEIGSKAIKSHTGSVAGNDNIYDSIFNQFKNIHRVNNFYEMFDIAQTLATQPKLKGNNLAIITSSGSLGALACDEMKKFGLNLAKLSKSTTEEMEAVSPNWTSVKNPVDLGPSMFNTFKPSIKALMNDGNVDALLFIFAVPRKPLEMFSMSIKPFLREMYKLSRELNKPIIACVYGSRWVLDFFLKDVYKYRIPVMTRIDHAIKSFKVMYDFNFSN